MNKLHIFDNGLKNKTGHHFEYSTSVYNEWVRRGGEVTIYSVIGVDEELTKKYTIRPLFTRYIYDYYLSSGFPSIFNGILNLVFGNLSYFRDLRRLGKNFFSKEDVVLIHTINHSMLIAIYLWYRLLSKDKLPYLFLLFRYNNIVYLPEKRYLGTYKIYKLFFRMLDNLSGCERIIYATDSEDLAKEYGLMTKKRLHVMPIPHIYLHRRQTTVSQDDLQEKVLVYLGPARDEKGYYLLPDAIKFVLNKETTTKIKFIVQSNLSVNPDKLTIKAKERLSDFGKNVVMIDRILETEEYYNLIANADAVLIPYCASFYYARTSGIFAEAVAMGKPVVIPRNTWMERQLLKFDGGGVTFEDGDPASLAEAILEFVEKYQEIGKKTIGCAQRWKQNHNAQTFVDALLNNMK